MELLTTWRFPNTAYSYGGPIRFARPEGAHDDLHWENPNISKATKQLLSSELLVFLALRELRYRGPSQLLHDP